MVVAIDPGHGLSNRAKSRYDPGCTAEDNAGNLWEEASVALSFGITLKTFLAEAGIGFFLTRRSAGEDAPLSQRVARAVEAGATRLVSIHLNASDSAQAHGTETLYRLDKHKPFAERMQAAVCAGAGLRDRGVVKRTDLAILKFPGPSVLIEMGFLTNDVDRSVIVQRDTRIAVCREIVAALKEYQAG